MKNVISIDEALERYQIQNVVVGEDAQSIEIHLLDFYQAKRVLYFETVLFFQYARLPDEDYCYLIHETQVERVDNGNEYLKSIQSSVKPHKNIGSVYNFKIIGTMCIHIVSKKYEFK